MNATHAVLMAGVLSLLAVGIAGAAPGGERGITPAAGAPTCGVHLSVYAPSAVLPNQMFQVIATASTSGGCTLHVVNYVFQGIVGQGPIVSHSGTIVLVGTQPGPISIGVSVLTNYGAAGAATVVVVE